MANAILSVFALLLGNFHVIVYAVNCRNFTKLSLPSNATGPLTFTFDMRGAGPYTGISDGRVVKYQGPKNGFVDFSNNSPIRNGTVCDGTSSFDLGLLCGRPNDVSFDNQTGYLYSSDENYGVTRVEPSGGLATTIIDSINGFPYSFLFGLTFCSADRQVYFTDFSQTYRPRDFIEEIDSNDTTGKLLKYDPITRNVTELRGNLSGGAGVECSDDGKYLIFLEFIAKRARKYWLTGPKAGSDEIIKNFTGVPNKIKRNKSGDYWVAVSIRKNSSGAAEPRAIKINYNGKVLADLDLSSRYSRIIDSVHEHSGNLYIGSFDANYVGVCQLKY